MSELSAFIQDSLESFDEDNKPNVTIKENLSLPIRAPGYILLEPSSGEKEAFFEIGFIAEQLILYLTHFGFAWGAFSTNSHLIISFSIPKRKPSRAEPADGYLMKREENLSNLLYLDEWGNHPEGLLTDNHKLETVLRYCRATPTLKGGCDLRFLMDFEYIHLYILGKDGSRCKKELLEAGMMIYNFQTSAELLNLKGVWKLLRDIDDPDNDLIKLPRSSFRVATWHGQLY